jgi:hypothetical protein
MAIALDAYATSAGNSPLTFAHTVAGTDRVLLVGVVTDSTATSPSVTYNGVSMTLIAETASFTIDGLTTDVSLFRLVAPATGANNVVVTGGLCTAYARSYTGVDQTTPVENGAATTGATVSQNIGSATGDLVVDVIGYHWAEAPAAGANQTAFAAQEGNNSTIRGSSEPGAASVTMSWGTVGTVNAGQVAVNVKAAGGGGGAATGRNWYGIRGWY